MSIAFDRVPAPGTGVRELVVNVGAVALSGLVSEPMGGDPRCLVVAVHGAGMHAGYWDAVAAPGMSLLQLGRELGFTVWAPDRPGIGWSGDLPDERIDLFSQARLLLDAIDVFAADHRIGAGVFLMGHSYGLKVALTMAAEPRGRDVLGIDGSGSGIRWVGRGGARMADGDRGPAWGPADLYPPATFSRGSLPLHEMPASQIAESDRWPDDLRGFGARIVAPVRLTFGQHERFWPVDEGHFAELRSVLSRASRFSAHIQSDVGHNVSLGLAARSYHLSALAFAEACVVARSVHRILP